MVEPALFPAIKTAVRQNEIGDASAYELSFARKGTSGGSFGACQGDTNPSELARDTLVAVLRKAGAGEDAVARILAEVSRPCPDGNPLTQVDTDLANAALASPDGQELVDRMDDQLLAIILDRVDRCIAAARARDLSIDADALLFIALWVNMTGPPNILSRWLGGSTELGVAAPAGPRVSRDHIETYLLATKFFRENPRNFNHMRESVEVGLPLLPPAIA
jgi:hypothetical protein